MNSDCAESTEKSSLPNTFFASPERLSSEDLNEEVKFVTSHPFVSGLLNSVGGLLSILNHHRQIITLNNTLLDFLGIDKPAEALGLRPGEIIKCVHAFKEEGGCGTSQFCSTCGAAIAIVTSLKQHESVEKICSLRATKDGEEIDLVLSVQANPIILSGSTYILLFLRDITSEQARAALERTFYHDINNMICTLVGASELLQQQSPSSMSELIHSSALRLNQEVTIQRVLTDKTASYKPQQQTISITSLFSLLEKTFEYHPARVGKSCSFHCNEKLQEISCDLSLLQRVLSNMIINALEATEKGEEIKIQAQKYTNPNRILFSVWNKESIDESIALRIFQRNFSTKGDFGRGIGTYSMKLLGETYLKGEVNFTTSAEHGTTFTFAMPLPEM